MSVTFKQKLKFSDLVALVFVEDGLDLGPGVEQSLPGACNLAGQVRDLALYRLDHFDAVRHPHEVAAGGC